MSGETAAPESTPAPPPAAAPGTADLLAPGEGPGTSTGATADPASETAPIHGPPSTVDAAPVDLRSPALYVNRELSWPAFHPRAFPPARDPAAPPVLGELQREEGICLTQEVIPALAERGIQLITTQRGLSPEDLAWLEQYFTTNVFPVLTPLAVDPAHPFPYISNLSLSLAVILRGDGGEERFARVKVPKILPRWIALPGAHRYVPLERVISIHLEALFPGVEILASYPFRITRNTDLEIDPDEADDLLAVIQEEVRNRRFAEVVRIEVHPGMPESLRQLLLAEFNDDQESEGLELVPQDVYEVEGLLDASDLM